jgi:hypothetical protein
MAPEPHDFRKAMGSFAAGVTVVTVCHDGRLVGTTVSAFSSVSMDPPLVMVCLKRDSRTLAALGQAKTFCVNILASDQGDLAYRFAKSGADDRFALTAVEAGVCGAPLLAVAPVGGRMRTARRPRRRRSRNPGRPRPARRGRRSQGPARLCARRLSQRLEGAAS